MIRHGRAVVDAAGAAIICGMSYQTFRNTKVTQDEAFPAPVNPGRRKLLYDRQQVEAYRDKRELPALPEPGHADDLLDEHEAAEFLGLAVATIRKDFHGGRLPGAVEVYGLRHWPRGVLAGVTRGKQGPKRLSERNG